MAMYQRLAIAACQIGIFAMSTHAEERQLTFEPKNHDLDGTHNFSGGNGDQRATGMPYLLGYYMGLYHGFIVE